MTVRFDGRAIPVAATEARWSAPDGQPIRRIDWPGHADSTAKSSGDNHLRGSILFLPGRGDFYEKYLETLDHWHHQGWRVTALDWRGQAGSGRFGQSPTTGHVDDFSTWIKDVSDFWAEWVAATPAPHVIVGHSMGGHLVLRALAEHRLAPDAAVLSAPMLGFHAPGPIALLHAVARLMCDNIAHVKAFWIATGVEVAQTALWFGVDDLDGTVQEEKIYHMAGARTPEAMTTRQLERLVRAAGREPVERDTLYNVVNAPALSGVEGHDAVAP